MQLPTESIAFPPEAQPLARLLLVDDDARLRQSFRLLLKGPDREIMEAGSGEEAMAMLRQQPIDLVLLDLGLPGQSGLDVLQALHQQRRPGTDVIVVSGEREQVSAVMALRRGALDFVRKPEDIALLPGRVQQVLQRQRLQRQHGELSARLAESERLHRFFVERSPDFVYALDEQGCFVFMNPRVEALLGYPRQALIGQHFSAILHEDDRALGAYVMAERRSDARASTNVELRLLCRPDDGAGGALRHVVVTVSSIGMYNGEDDQAASGEQRGRRRFVGTYGVVRDITERKRAEETIRFQALHDQLTDLPNRRLFQDHLALALVQAERRGQMVGVIFIDLDRFKLVNDTYGHRAGDELLRSVAGRLRGCVRAGDTVARLGGDEFTVLLPDLVSPADAMSVTQKILGSLEAPFAIGEHEFRATVSLGIATYPRDGLTAEQLIQNADTAMYEVKSSGRNGSCMFTPDMNAGHLQRRNLENDLRQAIAEGSFEALFQPLVSLRHHRVMAAELLLRWRHPVLGLLLPSTFIPLAESSGLVGGISDWSLERACAQLAQWQEQGHGDVRVAVNLSPLELGRADIVERVLDTMARHRVGPGLLELEITENLTLEESPGVVESLQRLQERGVRVAIDDFGTRYSLLSYLQRFPISGLKIDQSFVRELRAGANTAIVQAIIGIAQGFGLHLVAEGVENEEQLELLRALGCDEIQGFLSGRPMSPEALLPLLARRDLLQLERPVEAH